MRIEDIKKLAFELSKPTTSQKPSLTFSKVDGEGEITINRDDMEEVLRSELFDLCSTNQGFRRHKNDLFDLIETSVNINVPPKVEKFFEGFAVSQQFGMSDRPVFKVDDRRATIARGKTFVTKATSAGVYEVFRLGQAKEFTMDFHAIGAACQIQLEEFIGGRVRWADLLAVIEEGIEDRIYEEMLAVLAIAEKSLPAANKGTSANFEPKELEKVLATVSVYGAPVIMCTERFAREITEGTDWASEQEKVARRNTGYLANYKNAKIVIIPQTFEDETNKVKKVDDSKAYIFPAGKTGLFQIGYQGGTQVRDVENEDWSKELQTYFRFGVALTAYNDIGTYEITSLK